MSGNGQPPHKLLVDVPGNIIERKISRLFLNPGVKHDLDQHIAQLFAHMCHVPAVDRVDEFAHFVDQAAHERGVGLFLIPGTPTGLGPQPHHRLLQILNRAHRPTVAVSPAKYTEIFPLCLPAVPCVPWVPNV